MTRFFAFVFSRYPVKTRRMLELMPGLVSWLLILSPIWGYLFLPAFMAYFILFFDVYWFYKSFSLVITAHIASKKIAVAERQNWMEKIKELPEIKKMAHIIVIPNYKENMAKMRASIASIAAQTFNPKQLYVVLAMEQREQEAKEKA